MSVASGGTVALCKLVQRRLGGWVRLAAVRRPQKLRSEGRTLGGATVTELDDMRDGEEADHVHEQLESKSCGEGHTIKLCTSETFEVLHMPSLLTFDPAHCVDDDRSLSALGASTPQRLQGFQVAFQVRLA